MPPTLSRDEANAIQSLKRLAKRWPDTLWLFAGSGGVTILKTDHNGDRVHRGESIDQDYIVDRADLPADGGDW